jgi:hypothetical protein
MSDEFKPEKTANGIEYLANIDEYRSTELEYVKNSFQNIKIPKKGQFTANQLGVAGSYKPEVVITGARLQ